MTRRIAGLIRHGDYHQLEGVPSAHQPFALSDGGRKQAREAAAELHAKLVANGWTLDATIDSSRMLRAWETAAIFAAGFADVAGLQVAEFDALAERGVGCAANLTVETIETLLRKDPRFPDAPAGWKADSHYRLPLQGAESLLESGARVAKHLAYAMAAVTVGERDSLKLFVGHGAAFRHAAYYMGLLAFEDIARFSMHHCRPILIEYRPGGEWRHIGGEWKLRKPGEEAKD